MGYGVLKGVVMGEVGCVGIALGASSLGDSAAAVSWCRPTGRRLGKAGSRPFAYKTSLFRPALQPSSAFPPSLRTSNR